MSLVVPQAPAAPDFFRCDQAYGDQISPADCFKALEQMPTGHTWILYYTHADFGQIHIPQVYHFESCIISLELAGPAPTTVIAITPNDVRVMAAWLIQECAQSLSGIGGFSTHSLSYMISYITNSDYTQSTYYPDYTAFYTVSVTSPDKARMQPGNYDPSIPLALATLEIQRANTYSVTSASRQVHLAGAAIWSSVGVRMTGGGSSPWWSTALQTVQSSDKMTYECDASLGHPTTVDCAQIEWDQLGSDSDTVAVAPGAVKFLHSNTCYLAISSTVAVSLTWAQIRAAVAALMNVCIENPLVASQGGRAYYGTPSATTSGRKRRKRDEPNGWDALPPRVNISMYQQFEPWLSPEAELDSCTWKAVTSKQPIMNCHTP